MITPYGHPFGKAVVALVTLLALGVFLYYFSFANGTFHRSYRILSAEDAQRIANEAIATRNPAMCDQIKLSWLGSVLSLGLGPTEPDLRNWCVFAYAKTTDEPSLCKTLPRINANYCYETLAPIVAEPALCASIMNDSAGAAVCMAPFAKLKNDPSLCDELHDQQSIDSCNHELDLLRKR